MTSLNSSGTTPPWGRIVLAVLLAGTVPPFLSTMVVAVTGESAEVFSLLCHLVFPLLFGFWAGFSWPGSRTTRHIFLSLSAGLVTLVFNGLFILPFFYPGTSIWNSITFMVTISMVTLFFAGGYLGDLVEGWRSSTRNGEPGTELKLILALGPGIIGLITALIGLLGS
jgi:hypothetical protein